MGGVKDPLHQHHGSGGVLIFFRWFLLKNLIISGLINEYDRFIITRSDFMYQLPHPKMEIMDPQFIWIPDGEQYDGYTDRHAVLSKENVEIYLNIFNKMVTDSHNYYLKMKNKDNWNLEQLIKFHLMESGIENSVKFFPYIMYSVRTHGGSTRWEKGTYSAKHGYFIKYYPEYLKSTFYKNEFNKNKKQTIDNFYLRFI